METTNALFETANKASSAFGWRIEAQNEKEAYVFNSLNKHACTLLIDKKGKYKFHHVGDAKDKIMTGYGSIGEHTEHLLIKYYYAIKK